MVIILKSMKNIIFKHYNFKYNLFILYFGTKKNLCTKIQNSVFRIFVRRITSLEKQM